MTSTTTSNERTLPVHTASHRAPLAARLVAALLALAVAAIHVIDQGGFPGDKEPRYIGIGYYFLEATAVVVAVLLLVGRSQLQRTSLLLAAAVAGGPLLGYVLSRGPGLPDYSDDRGNWTETVGLASIAIEVALLFAVAVLARRRRVTR